MLQQNSQLIMDQTISLAGEKKVPQASQGQR